jgi:hypothetical protein
VTVLNFAAEACARCHLRPQCTTNPDGRSVTLNFHEARLQAARAAQARPSTRAKLRRRALIERKLAEAKRHGAGQARYRGTRKVLMQQRFTAALLNLDPPILWVFGGGRRRLGWCEPWGGARRARLVSGSGVSARSGLRCAGRWRWVNP